MEEKDLLELFGISEEYLDKSRKKQDSQKKEKKGTDSKKNTAKTEAEYSLPVTVYGSGYTLTISVEDLSSGESEQEGISYKALTKALKEKFPALDAFSFYLKRVEDMGQGDLVLYQKLSEGDESGGEGIICYGDTKLYFPGGPLEKAVKFWCREHPEFQGCHMAYNSTKRVYHPFFSGNTDRKLYEMPIQIGIMQHIMRIPKGDKKMSLKELQDIYVKEYPFYKGCSFFYSKEQRLLIPIMEEKSRNSKVEKVELPIRIRMALSEVEYGPEDFQGKEEVSLEDIRRKLEMIYPEYSKERTIMEYDERHFIIPILKSSSKGVILRSRCTDYAFYMAEGRNGNLYRIEKTPIGEFAVCLSEESERPEFHFALPKIPEMILEEVMHFFLQNWKCEAACQIFYEKNEGYSIYYPPQKATGVSVSFERNLELEYRKTLVMDLHSHGSLPAFFSAQDNRDEKGTRLFLVAGNLGGKPQICIRAGIIGRFTELAYEDIFEVDKDKRNR